MIFKIATFKIKIQQHQSALKFPRSFYKNYNKYFSDNHGKIDFIISIVPYSYFSHNFFKLLRQKDCESNGTKKIFFIKSRTSIACLNKAKGTMVLCIKNSKTKNINIFMFMAFVRLAVSFCAVLKGGLPLHSSAISYKNRGFAFVGPSGAGKSTIANLLVSPGQLLNDDFSIILPHRINSYRIYSTPFAKREILIKSVNRSAKLETIYFVKQGINNTIDNLSLKKKFVLLLGQSFIFSLVNYFGNKIFDNGEKIVSKVECKQLSFVNDKTIRPFIFQYAEG